MKTIKALCYNCFSKNFIALSKNNKIETEHKIIDEYKIECLICGTKRPY